MNQLGDTAPTRTSHVYQIVEALIAFWEGSSCSSSSQCKFNMSILNVAQQYLQFVDACDIFCQYVILSTKASKWCGKHFHSLVLTTNGSKDESHMCTFIQLLLVSLSFASATSSALAKCSYLFEDQFLLRVEDFISEQLTLIKVAISDIKQIHGKEPETVKASQELLGAAIRLSSIYCRSINSNANQPMNDYRDEVTPHIVNIASCAIENLYELGILAATGGGNLIAILNISWKGVVSLLQLEIGKEIMASKVNISNIILTLISLATESLKLSAQVWLLQSPDSKTILHTVTDPEARRSCIPIKFYLLNAVRISSSYPSHAFKVCDDIMSCVLKISALRFALGFQDHLRAASEALAEILEPTSFLFLCSLLNSGEAGLDLKLRVLDILFPNDSKMCSSSLEENVDAIHVGEIIIRGLFSSTSEDNSCSGILMLGRVAVLLNLLENSSDLGADMVLAISKRLDWLLGAMAQEDVYLSTLYAQIPTITHSDPPCKCTWQFMFYYIAQALKTFLIVAAPSAAWIEVESFLFRNIIHPHALCYELVSELWCFTMRHAQLDLIEKNIDTLCSLLRSLAVSDPTFYSHKSLRKLARSICTIIEQSPKSVVENVYSKLFSEYDIVSKPSVVIAAALLEEGFPLHLLSENSKKHTVLKITNAFLELVLKFSEKLGGMRSRYSPCASSSSIKEPIYFLSLMLSQCKLEEVEINDECVGKVPKLAVALIKSYKLAKERSQRHYYSNLLSYTLEVMSYVNRRLGSCDIKDVLTTLDGLFINGDSISDEAQIEFKPALALFLASLSSMEIPEDEGNAASKAMWKLYHLILRERHWAGVHLGLASFGYYAARTPCKELWRFVPLDAALSFDIKSGKESNVEQFMSELKYFLEKEGALNSLSVCEEEKNFLRREGMLQNKIIRNYWLNIEISCGEQKQNEQGFESQEMEIDANNSGKEESEFSMSIQQGMSLLQKGLSLLHANSAKWQDEERFNSEQRDKLAGHLFSLADIIKEVGSTFHSSDYTLEQ
ncbi:uncharacterized protein LOC131061428 isoform X2 [Cryptomeria japonica]|nr:uncharacterized protein LOC131061428 isoform X2 [Cryptomeria japonica]